MNENETKSSAYEKLTPQRKQLVDQVLANLEKGNLLWTQGWVAAGAPESVVTGKKYRGINNLYLSLVAMAENYGDNRWATFRQMEEKGWTFKKDEEGHTLGKGKSVSVEYYEMRDKETKRRFDRSVLDGMTFDEQREYMDKNVYWLRKFYRVFNCSLMDGVPAKEMPMIDVNDRIEKAEAILDYWNANESKIVYGGSQAFYRPSTDEVHLPEREKFKSTQSFYDTAFHEIGHSTGHESRLNRDLSGGFGSQSYAMEELRAEIASIFMAQDLGIEPSEDRLQNNAAYIQSWKDEIKENPNALFTAIADADKIARYVSSKEQAYRQTKDVEYYAIVEETNAYSEQVYRCYKIISPEIFAIVRKRIDANKCGKHVSGISYLLLGKAVCAYCGKKLSSYTGTARTGKTYRYYRCKTLKQRDVCRQQSIDKTILETLVSDAVPVVESTFSTYAEGTSESELKAARDHRAFGGFSMGSVTTWRTFEYALDYFRYFIPMSCGTSLDDEEIWRAADGRNQNDYFVMMMVGTSDFSYSYDTARVQNMLSSGYFTEQTENTDGNFIFRIKNGYSHNGTAANEYTYNALSYLWKTSPATEQYTADTRISDVINDPVFGDFGRLIFPVNSGYYSGDTLENLRLTWYNNINVAHTVEICNYLKNQTIAGNRVFYDIYTDEEKAADPRKENTGLFFFRGEKNAKFAVTCAGGGFAYVGAMHDSFPHALELSKRGYNTFAIIYRPGAQTAYEDLARAISFIFANAETLGVDTNGYSVWGGSAGGRMAATISSYGVEEFGGATGIPKPSVAVIQYTGHTDYNPAGEPATFVTVGENDGIANYRAMKARIDALAAMDVPTEYHSYKGLGHGFGLGVGTIAEGWIDQAVAFWEKNT